MFTRDFIHGASVLVFGFSVTISFEMWWFAESTKPTLFLGFPVLVSPFSVTISSDIPYFVKFRKDNNL